MAQQPSRQVRRRLARKGKQEVGFSPSANKKVTGTYQSILALLVKMNEKRMVPMSSIQMQNEAFDELRRRLPKVPIGVRTAPFVKPSKSDDPAYRRGGNFDKATGQPRQKETACAA